MEPVEFTRARYRPGRIGVVIALLSFACLGPYGVVRAIGWVIGGFAAS